MVKRLNNYWLDWTQLTLGCFRMPSCWTKMVNVDILVNISMLALLSLNKQTLMFEFVFILLFAQIWPLGHLCEFSFRKIYKAMRGIHISCSSWTIDIFKSIFLLPWANCAQLHISINKSNRNQTFRSSSHNIHSAFSTLVLSNISHIPPHCLTLKYHCKCSSMVNHKCQYNNSTNYC